jgi:aldehyde dehydrogenase (NAD+)
MNDAQLKGLKAAQESYFRSGATRSYDARRDSLTRLRDGVVKREKDIVESLRLDLGKPAFESWGSEIGFLLAELDHALSHLKSWMKPEKVQTPLLLQPSTSRILREPHGNCLIIGPWNYPLMLVLTPLVAALAAGNTVLIKPSELAQRTCSLLEQMIRDLYPPEQVATLVGPGEVVVPSAIEHFEPRFIFFTGSERAGRAIAVQAAQRLTPVLLELGGKSPAVLDGSTPMDVTAKRIMLAKFLNAGQTCVAPDYVLVQRDHLAPFVAELTRQIQTSYGPHPLKSQDLAQIVNERHFERLRSLMESGRIVCGGQSDEKERRIAPTILVDVDLDSPLMKEEIFGPLLPVLPYENEEELLSLLDRNPDPLSLYVFSRDRAFVERLISGVRFGGGAINNAAVQLGNPHLPFGGVGRSGHGSYHGRFGFEAFSHKKSILDSGTWFDPPFKYAPYSESALRMLKKVM